MTQLKFINRPVAKQFDNFFNDFFTPSVWSNPSNDVTSIPAANVHETPASYVLEINAPGRNKEDFKVNVDKDLLTVSYEKKEETTTEGQKLFAVSFSSTVLKEALRSMTRLMHQASRQNMKTAF